MMSDNKKQHTYRHTATLLSVAMMLLVFVSCSHKDTPPMRSMYYWSTTFNLSKAKTTFLHQHHIKRLYIRYFDVVLDDNEQPMPNATIQFKAPIPQGIEVIPTVFIVNDCMRKGNKDLAQKILKRILQMNATNDIPNVKEIQVDCDWTHTTRPYFFYFMKELRQLAHSHHLHLSATIRLHQLSQAPPPADRGILMLYNTGDFTKLDCHKPILDMYDVAPYLPQLSGYNLPLSTAYPIFGWRILFREGQYVGIIHADDDLPILPQDSIAIRQPTLQDVTEGVKAIEERRSEVNDEMILFDLTDKNIKRFKPDDYEKIFNRSHHIGMHPQSYSVRH